jgi:N-methylhydantoinase B
MNRHPLQGHAGGRPGVGNHVILDYGAAGETRIDDWAFEHPIGPGRLLFAQSQGGGGWGDPLERDPDAVREDVVDEYVSVAGARRDYGVVIDPETLAIDPEATRSLRADMRSAEVGDGA